MAIIASNKPSGPHFLVPAGSHIARCFQVVDIGTREDTYEGKPRTRRVVRITWELPDELIEKDGKSLPAVISKNYTLSLHEKSGLRKDLEAWRGKAFTPEELKGFDISELCGQPALLSVVHKQKQDGEARADVSSVAKPPKGLECGIQVNPSMEYSVASHDQASFDKLPQFLRDQIMTSAEWLAQMKEAAQVPDTSEEAPF